MPARNIVDAIQTQEYQTAQWIGTPTANSSTMIYPPTSTGLTNEWRSRSNPDEPNLLYWLNAFSKLNHDYSQDPTAMAAFQSYLVRNKPHTFYRQVETCWLPQSPSSFTENQALQHRFLYWDPISLGTLISCGSCSTPLHKKGLFDSGPIMVYDLEQPFFIIGCAYVCEGICGIYASTDYSIMCSLPSRIRDDFPAHLLRGDKDFGAAEDVWSWKGRGISKRLWNLVSGCREEGLKHDSIIRVVKGLQHWSPNSLHGVVPFSISGTVPGPKVCS